MGNFMLPLDGIRKPYAYLQTPFNERMPAFSPDGRWLAYASDESGRFEVYVQRFPGPGMRREALSSRTSSPIASAIRLRTRWFITAAFCGLAVLVAVT